MHTGDEANGRIGDPLAAAVRLAADLAGADAAHLLLLDEPAGRLWLAATTGAADAVGRYSIPRELGLSGWVIRMRAPLLLPRDPQGDPRYLVDPAFGCDRWRSALALPVATGDGEPCGALLLYSEVPGRLDREAVDRLGPLTGLIASAAAAGGASAASGSIATALALLGDADDDDREALAAALAAARALTAARAALIVSRDGRRRWRLEATAGLNGSIHADRILDGAVLDVVSEVAGVAALPPSASAAVTAALGLGAEPGGVLCARVPSRTAPSAALICAGSPGLTPAAAPALALVRTHCGLLLDRVTLTERLQGGDAERALLAALARPGDQAAPALRARARRLGADLTRPHVAVVATLLDDRGAARLRRELRAGLPGTVAVADGAVTRALLRVDDVARATAVVRCAGGGAIVAAGVSRPEGGVERLGDALADADEARRVALALHPPGTVATIDALGPDRHVFALAQREARDELERRLAALPPPLRATAEAYAAAGGNVVEAARRLGIHRNTARARLAALRDAPLPELDDAEGRFALQLACRVLRARSRPLALR